MFKVRLLLVAFILGSLSVSSSIYFMVSREFGIVAFIMLALPTLTAFLATFLRYTQLPDGTLKLDKNQLLYKLLYFCGDEFVPRSLCGTVWKATASIFIVCVALAIVTILIFFVLPKFALFLWGVPLEIWGVLLLTVTVSWLILRTGKRKWNALSVKRQKLPRAVGHSARRIALAAALSLFSLLVFTTAIIEFYVSGMTLWQAILHLFMILGITCVIIATLFLLCFGIVYSLGRLKNVPFVQAAKQAICPRIAY